MDGTPDEPDPKKDPSLRQQLHSATGDRDAEAAALADRAGDQSDIGDAEEAVREAHGDRPHGPASDPNHDLATSEDIEKVTDGDST